MPCSSIMDAVARAARVLEQSSPYCLQARPQNERLNSWMHIPAAGHEGRAAPDYPVVSLSMGLFVRSRLPSWAVLNRWLVGGSLLVLVLLAALVLDLVNTRQQQFIARQVVHTHELLDAIADTRAQLLLLASADQTFLLTGAGADLRRLV